MRVVFLGNHTVGVRTLDALCACADVVGVVAHPEDPEDGVRYASLFEHAQSVGLPVVRLAGSDGRLVNFVASAAPDLLWIADYRYLLPADVLALTPLGAVNLHPSLLPAYRGRAPLNWAILNGETELGLTAHFVEATADTGDIIAQERFILTPEEDVSDALERLYPLYERLTRKVLGFFAAGDVPRRPQSAGHATTFPRRRPEDGRIDWTQPADRIQRLVRAVTAPYPGAFAPIHGRTVLVWKATTSNGYPQAVPGRVVAVHADGAFTVACGGGALHVKRWTVEPADGGFEISIGDAFEGTPAMANGEGALAALVPAGVGAEMDETESARAAFAHVATHFGSLARRYGYDHRAIDYGGRGGQRQRFEVLAGGLPLAGRRVLDVGCGFADLADDLDRRGVEVAYEGVDLCPELIAEARRRRPDLPLSVRNMLEEEPQRPCDIAIANGIFYLLGESAEMLMQRIVARMFDLAQEAVAFTSLSAWATQREPGEFHADPRRVVTYCKTLTPHLTVRHDYMAHDFAVFLYKRGPAA